MSISLKSLVAGLTLAMLPALATAAPLDSMDADWARTAVSKADALAQAQPGLAQAIATGTPNLSRTGQPLFVDATWRVPEATGALLVRIADGGDSAAERVGLLDALSRTQGDWSDAVVGLLADESSSEVRRMMVEVLREAPVESARLGVQMGLSDPQPEVRAAAARVVGNHPDGSAMGDLAVMALSDSVVAVRTEAARSIGYCGYSAGFGPMRTLLTDGDADVRFRALRSLDKLDHAKVVSMPELSMLATDADPRIAREASKLLGR
jgi:hypothetical protein